MSLRFRVNLAISLIGLIFIAVIAYTLINYKRQSIAEEIDAGTKVTIQLLESISINPTTFQSNTDPTASLVQYLQSVGRVRANELRFFDNRNVLLYESPPSNYKQGRWAPNWFTSLVAPHTPDVRLSLPMGSIVITPDSSRSVLDAWDELSRFGLLILGFFLLLNLAVFRMLGRSLEPLKGILAAMSEMERGNLESRLPEYGLPEFNSIGHTFNRMASSLEDALTQNARLALIAKQSSDAIMIRNLDGHFSFANPAVEQIFGFPAEEVVGATADIIFPKHSSTKFKEIQSRALGEKSIQHWETQLSAKNGRLIEVAVSIAPLIDPSNDEVMGEIYAIRDMTEHTQRMAAEVELEQNRQITQLIHEKLEEERKTIARELHDELGQCVTAIRTIGTAIVNRSHEQQAKTRQNAETIVELATHIYDIVHSIIRQLRPSALDHLGLCDAVTELVDRYKQQHPSIAVALAFMGELNQFDEKVNITVYRIVQECLTNAAKHADAQHVDIQIVLHEEDERRFIEIKVSDDGKGVSADSSEGQHFGLLGMGERVQAFGGNVRIESSATVGTTVHATLPLQARASARNAQD